MEGKAPLLEGDYIVPHFDCKGSEGNQAFLDLKVPTTFFYTTFYTENFINYGLLRKGEDGNYSLTFNMG